MHGVWILVAALVLFGWYAFVQRKKMENARLACKEAWKEVDVLLHHRYKLATLLVKEFSPLLPHEKNMFAFIQKTCDEAKHSAGAMREMSHTESALSQALYMAQKELPSKNPALQKHTRFLQFVHTWQKLQTQLENTRRFYNGNVLAYNTLIEDFPCNVVAGIFQFESKVLFELKEPTDEI